MLVHKGGQISNVQLISGVRIAEMSQLQNCSAMCINNGSYYGNEKIKREKVMREGGGGSGGYVQGLEVTVKKKKKSGGQGRCERKSEAFVKIQKRGNRVGEGPIRGWGGGGAGGSKVWGRWVMWGKEDVNQEKKALINVNKGFVQFKNN